MSLFSYSKQKKKLILEALVVSFVVAFVFTAILPKVFAITAYYFPDAVVELDGTNDGSVTISLNTPIADTIYSIEGNFQTSDSTGNFALTALNPAGGISPSSNVVSDGRILWSDASYEDLLQLNERGSMWSATYKVDKDTPAGNYSLCLVKTFISSLSNDYNTPSYGNLCATVTVTRSGGSSTKPTQTITFLDGEGDPITEITKHYGDDPFVVDVVTTEGEVVEYHPMDGPDDDHVVVTNPDSNTVFVGAVGEVDVCARVEETENYAETTACYKVYVQKRPLDIIGVTIANKTYDGTTSATVTSVSFEDKTLSPEEYNATASFEETDAGENVVAHVSVELTGGAENNYVLNASDYNTTGTILPFHLVRDDVELLGSGTYSYSPSGVRPGVKVTAYPVYGGEYTLVEGREYEVAYSDNMSVGTGRVTVTGKGNYTTNGVPVVIEFTIEARGINSSNLVAPNTIVEDRILTADDININVDGVNLVRCESVDDTNCDYTLSITGNTGIVGDTVNVTAEGRNNYTGVAGKDINIVAKLEQTVSFSGVSGDVTKTYGDEDFTYTATTTGNGNITYTSSNDSVATVDLNSGLVEIVGVGEANIVAKAAETDTYAEGIASYHLVVGKKTVTIASVTVSNKVYDGTTDATVINAVLSDDDLLIGDGFSIDEVHFTDAGVGSYDDVYVRIKLDSDAFGLYQFEGGSRTAETAGSAEITAFTLGADNSTVALVNTTYAYDGEEKKPTANVVVDLDGDGIKETVLTAGTDYTINYSSNTDAGTASATIAGKGNYTGSLAALEFTISKFVLNADNTSAELNDTAYTYDGEKKKPTANVTLDLDGDGTKEIVLTAGTDYTISYNDNIDAGTATATIAGKGNYTGSLSAIEFTINKATSGDPTEMTSGLSAEVGKTLADLGELSEGFAWVDPTTPITAGMNNYPATYTQDGDTSNYTTIDVSVPVLGFTEEYEVIVGAGQEYVIGESKSALFEIDADYELFEEGGEVYVDNEFVEAGNYDSWSNSTVIEFNKGYMDSLALGEHLLAVLFNDGGVARTTFKVVNPTIPDDEAENGDSTEESGPATADTGVFTGTVGGAVATSISTVVLVVIAGVIMRLKKIKKED